MQIIKKIVIGSLMVLIGAFLAAFSYKFLGIMVSDCSIDIATTIVMSFMALGMYVMTIFVFFVLLEMIRLLFFDDL